MGKPRPALRLAICAMLALATAWPELATAQAQADPEREARRQRLQLQRAQAELEEAAAQRDALQAAKAAAEGKARQQQTAAAAGARNLAASKADIARQQTVIETLQAALLAQVEASKRLQTEAAARESALREELAAARRDSADRLQTVRALSGLLERSTAAMRQAENRIDALYKAGLTAVEQYRTEAVKGDISLTDPLGWRAVRRENTVDALRDGLERQPPQATKPQSSR